MMLLLIYLIVILLLIYFIIIWLISLCTFVPILCELILTIIIIIRISLFFENWKTIIRNLCICIFTLYYFPAYWASNFIITILNFFSKKIKIAIVNYLILFMTVFIIKLHICIIFNIDFSDFKLVAWIGIPMIFISLLTSPKIKSYILNLYDNNLSSDADDLIVIIFFLLWLLIIEYLLLWAVNSLISISIYYLYKYMIMIFLLVSLLIIYCMICFAFCFVFYLIYIDIKKKFFFSNLLWTFL